MIGNGGCLGCLGVFRVFRLVAVWPDKNDPKCDMEFDSDTFSKKKAQNN